VNILTTVKLSGIARARFDRRKTNSRASVVGYGAFALG
jgi:hypothetical protein